MRTIYYSGNALVEKDSLPMRLAESLQREFPDISFTEFDPTENIPSKELCLIDSAEGIREVTLITDTSQLAAVHSVSLHDFDLAFNLKLMAKLGMVTKLRIYALPIGMSEQDALAGLKKIISSEPSGSE